MADPSPAPKMVKLRIDGREAAAPMGTSILEAAKALGIEIPTFCYHPGLSVAGNCRICLVEASNSKKPITACSTPVAEGIEVQTNSEMARKARAGVLEFMLLNHPLDCPICDKAGECMLQDHTYDHGKPHSRMVEPKVLRHTKRLGPETWIWGNRCIVCTRCVRFTEEISGGGELCIVERGDRSVVDIFPSRPLGDPLAGNVIDICPVGALISQDFLYRARVWFTKKTESVCDGCARGCNIEVQTLENRIARVVPRENRAVNGWWMCDHGRFGWKHAESPRRLFRPRPSLGPGESAGRRIAGRLRAAADRSGPASVAGIATPFMTLEELHLFRRLLERLGSDRIGILERPAGKEERFKGGFVISSDKNPNRRGAELILGREAIEDGSGLILEALERGEIRGLIVVANLPGLGLDERLLKVLGHLEYAALFILDDDPRIPSSCDIFPAAASTEKDGTLINDGGRVQRLRPALAIPPGGNTEAEIFQEALVALGERESVLSADGVFRELGEKGIPGLRGLSHKDLGSLGRPLEAMGGS